jgi:hypothetical protein
MKNITPTDKIVNLKSRDPIELECYECKSTYQHAKHRYLCYKLKGKLSGCFCTQKCAMTYKSKLKNINTKCEYCKKDITKSLNQYKKSKLHFCSTSCSATHWNKIHHPIRITKSKIKRTVKLPILLTCTNCSNQHYRKYYKPSKSSTNFCTRSCQSIYANKTWNKSSRFGINKSRCETILKNIILNEFPNLQIIENDRTTIKGGLEIDLHIPSKNVAIELNGPCHYIPIFGTKELEKTQNKDLIKIEYCQNNNIKLFVVNVMGLKNQIQTLTDVFNTTLKSHLV